MSQFLLVFPSASFCYFDIPLLFPSSFSALHTVYLLIPSPHCWLWCFLTSAHSLHALALQAWITLHSPDFLDFSLQVPQREAAQGCQSLFRQQVLIAQRSCARHCEGSSQLADGQDLALWSSLLCRVTGIYHTNLVTCKKGNIQKTGWSGSSTWTSQKRSVRCVGMGWRLENSSIPKSIPSKLGRRQR